MGLTTALRTLDVAVSRRFDGEDRAVRAADRVVDDRRVGNGEVREDSASAGVGEIGLSEFERGMAHAGVQGLERRCDVGLQVDEECRSILIGRGGAAIRNLGSAAREKIEAFVGSRVYLDLWVKVAPGWRRRAPALRMLGYPVPETAPASAQRPGGAANRRPAGRSRTSSQGT